ncbi:MAG: serine hydroxymethyltransferase [Alphaproteobacteria bacterium]|nr:MAG: serine hydroxymethyltransferase [Alphaproteobacteria bacterium]
MPRPRSGPGARDAAPRDGEIYVEFRQVGNAMRVTAVDAASGEEVVVMGPVHGRREELQRIAVRKLKMRLGAAD